MGFVALKIQHYFLSIPIYSAELHPSNRSKIVSRQLEGIKKALDVENKAVLYDFTDLSSKY